MQNKFIFNTVKWFFYIVLLLVILSFSQIFSGCSGSEEEVENFREKDSISVYTNLQKSFSLYKKALTHNESSDDQAAREAFEASLKYLNEINYELITRVENYFWKLDYDEIAKSVVEDYLTTQSEISQGSLVFEFASRVPVMYEKIEQFKQDKEPLPEGSDVPLIRNSAVDEYIEFFSKTERGRTFIDKCLYRSGIFFPIMRKILKSNNAPEELIYLSVQESGLNPTIVSRAGAVGLWQFMPATGYAYDLGQDGYRDDRRDFEKATESAAQHLKDLYRTYDDWYLAFSAYNAGPGRVNSAINKSGSRDFWSLRGYLPGETKNYVPSIIALSFVLRSPEEYGFNDVEYGKALTYDRVNIRSSLTLDKVAELCETDIESIRDLNPEITTDQLPVYDVPYQMRIPDKTFEKFSANFKKANDIDKSNDFSPEFAGNENSGYVGNVASVRYKVKNYEPGDSRSIGSTNGKKKVLHEVQKKQLLSSIAVFYDVRPIEIRMWNNLTYGSIPETAQKLNIYISEEKYKRLYGIKDDNTLNNEVAETKSDITSTTETKINSNDPVPIPKEEIPASNNSSEIISKNNSPEDNSELPDTPEKETLNSKTEYYEETETEQPGARVEETKVESNYKIDTYKTHTVKEGDNLTAIAKDYGATLSDLREWNNLQTDKIIVGQRLKIYTANTKTSVHVVEEGEYLSMIAKEYGLSLSELKELNNLNDDKILVGQKLKVIEVITTKKNNTKKTPGVKKTYKVKKGETLASIAEENDISIQDLLNWNSLESDKIIVGQVLKLYKEETKSKIRRKKK